MNPEIADRRAVFAIERISGYACRNVSFLMFEKYNILTGFSIVRKHPGFIIRQD